MNDNTIELVSLALDAALMRQTAIASNIANNHSANYQPLEVNFEEQLNGVDKAHLASVKPFFQPAQTMQSIDENMTLNIQNMTQYRALIKGINQKLSIMKMALQGNNAP